ncbi:MAG: hypothetical protein A2Y12_07685 [Planctomycetes bacterium GWF2_42_9]|nr:MAG: hypothetical protein A2Y12_07685 [Planctomycetes bacterium GWF2_42_9]HAL44386.1 hypothetical protein [Phycisphaerales bacterium]
MRLFNQLLYFCLILLVLKAILKLKQPERLNSFPNMDYLKRVSGQLVVFLALLCGAVCAEPNNGSFEFSEPNETTTYLDPNEWVTENIVTVSEGFTPESYAGEKNNWKIPIASNFPAFKKNKLLVLSTGDSSVKYSQAKQKINIHAGDKLTGVYFFGACDYRPYNDFGEIRLEPTIKNPELSEIQVVYTDIEMLGSYGSFYGWKRFEYTFSEEQAGEYDLVLYVEDGIDTMLESYFLVDGLVLCRYSPDSPLPDDGDINCDCKVNMEDFKWIANDWGYNCADTNTYDPTCNCLLGTDLDNSGYVDFNDILIMSDNWLFGIKEEENTNPVID